MELNSTALIERCRAASVEIATFYPAANSWQLVQRTPQGRKEIECGTHQLMETLESLAVHRTY